MPGRVTDPDPSGFRVNRDALGIQSIGGGNGPAGPGGLKRRSQENEGGVVIGFECLTAEIGESEAREEKRNFHRGHHATTITSGAPDRKGKNGDREFG